MEPQLLLIVLDRANLVLGPPRDQPLQDKRVQPVPLPHPVQQRRHQLQLQRRAAILLGCHLQLLVFSTVQSNVQAGAIRVEISNPDQWSPGDVAILQNQEAKKVKEIGDQRQELKLGFFYRQK